MPEVRMMSRAVHVELDIFSGMPNPAWRLTDAEANDFLDRLGARPDGAPAEAPGRLGYRGFIVLAAHDGVEERIHVYGGALSVTRGGASRGRRDDGRALERWLLDAGRSRLPADLVALVEQDLAAGSVRG